MRSSALVSLATLLTVTVFGCADVDTGSSVGLRRAPKGAPPAVGSADDHDPNDTGDDVADVGNPHADTRPSAPDSQGSAAPQFALTLSDDTPVADLGQEIEISVAIEPKNGFTGPVSLAVTGLPPGASAAPAQASVTAGTTGWAKLKIRAAPDAVPSAPDTSSAIVVTGTSGKTSATANANFKIAPRLTLTIPLNVDALRAASVQYRDEWGAAFGATQKPLRTQPGNGIVVRVFNADSKGHIVHGANGFAHGDVNAPIEPNAFEMQNGQVRTRTLNPGANVNGYPHDGPNGVGASFRIKVEEAP